jgi:hypothetical protein
MSTPGTPSRRNNAYQYRDQLVQALSLQWDLRLTVPKNGESPSKRQEKLAVASNALIEKRADQCVFKVTFLCLKNKAVLKEAVNAFERNAAILHQGWVNKPRSDPDTFPRTGRKPPPISVNTAQRLELLECLHRHVEPAYEREKKSQSSLGRTRSVGDVSPAVSGAVSASSLLTAQVTTQDSEPLPIPAGRHFDDEPIPFYFGVSPRGKRTSDGSTENNNQFKKPKLPPPDDAASRSFNKAIDDVPVRSRPGRTISGEIASQGSSTVPGPAVPHNESTVQQGAGIGGPSGENSFMSNVSSIFSHAPGESLFSRASTQSTVETSFVEPNSQPTTAKPLLDSQSPNYGSTPDYDEAIKGSVTEVMEIEPEHMVQEEGEALLQNHFREKLDNIFRKSHLLLTLAFLWLPKSVGSLR